MQVEINFLVQPELLPEKNLFFFPKIFATVMLSELQLGLPKIYWLGWLSRFTLLNPKWLRYHMLFINDEQY